MEEILKKFTSHETYRHWMMAPFRFDGHSGATDGVFLIVTEGEIPGLYALSEIEVNRVWSVVPAENKNIQLLLSDLKAVCEKAPLVDEMEWKGENIECKACEGSGEVEFEFTYNHKDYYHDHDCPICEGSGYESEEKRVPTGRKIKDPDALIQFDFTRIKLMYVERLIKVLEYEKEKSISIVYKGDAVSPILFKTAKSKVVIMPVVPTDREVILHRFQLNV